jgi:undecaprenyl-diphosphatase
MFGTLAIIMLVLTASLWWLIERWDDRWWEAVAARWRSVLKSPFIVRLLEKYPRLRSLRESRIVAGGYLGVHSVVGFMVIVAAMAVFAQLADEISEDESFARFDQQLTSTLTATATATTLRAFYLITHFGNPMPLTALCIAVAALLLYRKRWLLAASWTLALAGNGLLNRFLKWIFQRERPIHDHGLLVAQGWSFPSGHASGALVAYGMLAYLLVRTLPRTWHLPVVCVAIAMILAIGFSRVFLQVHYFSDVIAGYMSGLTWLVVCIAGSEIVLHDSRRRAGGMPAT